MIKDTILIIFIPAIFTVLGIFNNKWNHKKGCIWLFTLFPIVITFLIRFLINERYTIFEYLFIDSLLSIISLLFFSIYSSKTISKEKILKTLCYITIIVVCYSTLTYGQTKINSDTATASILVKSILNNKCLFPKTWNYANGDIWVFNLWPECFLPTMLLKNKTFARMLGSLFQSIIAMFAIYVYSKKINKDKSWLIIIPILFVFLVGSKWQKGSLFPASSSESIIYQGSYTNIITFLVLFPTLYIYSLKDNRKYKILFYILIVLLCMGGIRYIAEIVLPLLMTCFILSVIELKKKDTFILKDIKRISFPMINIALSSLLGLLIYKWLCTWHNVNNSFNNKLVFVSSLDELFDNIKKTLMNLLGCFGYTGGCEALSLDGIVNISLMVMCIIVCFIVPYLQYKKIDNEDENIKFCLLFLLLHNIVLISTIILFGKVVNSTYLLSSVFAFVIISGRYIYKYWINEKHIIGILWTSLFLIATIIQCTWMTIDSIGWSDILIEKKDFNNRLIENGLTKGYASFWNAYSNSIYSDMNIVYGGIKIEDSSIDKYFWLVDSKTFNVIDNKNTFLMLDKEENDNIKFSITELFGNPIEKYVDNNYYIYVFDHDIGGELNDGLKDGILMPSENLFISDDDGIKEHNQITIYPFGSTYGPYIDLSKGNYKVEIKGYNLKEATVNVWSCTDGKPAKKNKISGENEKIEYMLCLKNDMENIEFQINNPTEELEYVYCIIVDKLD